MKGFVVRLALSLCLLAAGMTGTVAAAAPQAEPAAPARESSRHSPVVRVVEQVAASVVNVSTEQRVENPFHQSGLDRFFPSLFEGLLPPGGRAPQGDQPEEQYVENSLGSGVLIDPNGYILTNEHVIWRASRVRVVLADRRKFEAEVVGVDPRSDLAVLKIEAGGGLPCVRPGGSSDLLIGETVIAIGNPYGLSNTVTTGVVSALRRSIKAGDRVYSDFIQTDASINPGNSGGPLLNIDGDLIGINTAILGEGQGIGFAIPVDRARKVFDDLVRYGEVRVAWLGLDVRDLTDAGYAAIEGAEAGKESPGALSVPSPGASVRRVFAGSPAERAGLAAGDLVTKVGATSISSRTDYETAVSHFKAGDQVHLTYRHGSALRDVDLAATEFPEDLCQDYLIDQIGLELSDIPEGLRRQYPGLPRDGVIVTRVRNPSRGYLSGLERGDVLRGIDDQPVGNMAALKKAVPRMVGRDAVLLKVVRGRFQYHVTVDLT